MPESGYGQAAVLRIVGASVVKSTAVLAGLDIDRCMVMQTGKRMMNE
jgi:hypothetical protein